MVSLTEVVDEELRSDLAYHKTAEVLAIASEHCLFVWVQVVMAAARHMDSVESFDCHVDNRGISDDSGVAVAALAVPFVVALVEVVAETDSVKTSVQNVVAPTPKRHWAMCHLTCQQI